MGHKEEHIKKFIDEVNELFEDQIHDLASKYGLQDDYIYVLSVGVYPEEEDHRLVVSMTADVDNDEEFETIVEAQLNIYQATDNNEPKPGTIEWWIKNYGGDSLN